ncbi:hypothetical protein T265_10534 [Opisthorchis viverrini]|uniref:Uncharacterized protein n=1 Tax=Opisthorchis viverrini TaxID=6198 RepID=A0A074Z1Z3_OPIVI|nr:hypothetical protein T265_10534 [Opisthorchis viverrini]KER21066.1 hypothetical protein T265_10534 [Opisthorchis viverrini]
MGMAREETRLSATEIGRGEATAGRRILDITPPLSHERPIGSLVGARAEKTPVESPTVPTAACGVGDRIQVPGQVPIRAFDSGDNENNGGQSHRMSLKQVEMQGGRVMFGTGWDISSNATVRSDIQCLGAPGWVVPQAKFLALCKEVAISSQYEFTSDGGAFGRDSRRRFFCNIYLHQKNQSPKNQSSSIDIVHCAAFSVPALKQVGQQAASALIPDSLHIDVCCVSEAKNQDARNVVDPTVLQLFTRFQLPKCDDPETAAAVLPPPSIPCLLGYCVLLAVYLRAVWCRRRLRGLQLLQATLNSSLSKKGPWYTRITSPSLLAPKLCTTAPLITFAHRLDTAAACIHSSRPAMDSALLRKPALKLVCFMSVLIRKSCRTEFYPGAPIALKVRHFSIGIDPVSSRPAQTVSIQLPPLFLSDTLDPQQLYRAPFSRLPR